MYDEDPSPLADWEKELLTASEPQYLVNRLYESEAKVHDLLKELRDVRRERNLVADENADLLDESIAVLGAIVKWQKDELSDEKALTLITRIVTKGY